MPTDEIASKDSMHRSALKSRLEFSAPVALRHGWMLPAMFLICNMIAGKDRRVTMAVAGSCGILMVIVAVQARGSVVVVWD